MSTDFYTRSILPHAGIIIKICRAYTNTQQDFEDYYQEVCLQIWRSRDNFKGQSQWSTWIYRLSLNVCLTYLKKDKNNAENKVLTDDSAELAISMVDESEISQLYQAIKKLSEVDRAVILLYLEDNSYQQIAEITGTNSNNIGVRIKRIKERLNKILNIVER